MMTVGGIGMKSGVVDGSIAIREYLILTISFDHEMIDGAPSARFTRRLKEQMWKSLKKKPLRLLRSPSHPDESPVGNTPPDASQKLAGRLCLG
jgi:hypothetical protein